MPSRFSVTRAAGAAAFAAVAVVGLLSMPPHVRAQEYDRVQQGHEIAPVPLNLVGRDYALVGLGSYLVNAVGDCNGCHTAGSAPLALYPFITGNNPYFSQPKKVDPSVYLAGGTTFGTVGTPTGPSGYAGPVIMARNLTPDKNGLPEGGHTLAQFKQIMRAGVDFDHIHPTCTAAQITAIQNGATPVCIPTGPIVFDPTQPPYNNIPNGKLLQIMPWSTFQQLTDHDIHAIYEYLSAIPCIDNTFSTPPAGAPNELRNDCGNSAAPADATGTGAWAQPALRSHQIR